MDYLIYSLGTTGDALPFIRLTATLNSRGAEAAFIGNEKFSALAKSYGVKFISVSSRPAYDKTYNSPLTWSPAHSQNHYNEFHFPAIKPTFKVIRDFVQQGKKPLVVFQDSLSGARMACEEYGLASCQVALAPYAIYSALSPAYPMCRQVEERLWGEILSQIKAKSEQDTYQRLVKPLINPARRELGLKEWRLQDLPKLQSSPAIMALFPNWFKPAPEDWPAQLVNTGFILGDVTRESCQQEIDRFIEFHGAPLVFSFGTGIPVTIHLIEKIKKVCHSVGRPGIFVAHSQTDRLIADCSPPVFIVSATQFSRLFSRAALVIHHGGIGTCAQALAMGIPQIISPYAFDQPDNAYLLWRLGVSNSVDFLSAPVSEISELITELLNSASVAENVKKYASLTKDETESSTDYLLSLR